MMQVYGLNVIDAVYYFLKPHYLELVCHYVVLVLSLVSLAWSCNAWFCLGLDFSGLVYITKI